MSTKFCLNNFLSAMSFALDYAGATPQDQCVNHSRRVAIIASRIGQELGLEEEELHDLVSCALLHSNGRLQSMCRAEKEGKVATDKEQCAMTEDNVKAFPFLRQRKDVFLYERENYDGTGTFGKSGDEIPLFSQIIAIAHKIEKDFKTGDDPKAILKGIQAEQNKKFSYSMVDAFTKAQLKTRFYLDLDDWFVLTALREMPTFEIKIKYSELYQVCQVFASIADAKSLFTTGHSVGVAERAREMARFYEFDEETTSRLVVAGLLHDIGKLIVPSEIINKNGKLTADEFDIIKRHVYYTKMVLGEIAGFEEIARIASNHHEKLNGKGYIFGYDRTQLDFNSKLLAVIDIYQALTEAKPYRKSMNHVEATKVLKAMAQNGEVSTQMVKDVDRVFNNRTT